MCLQMEQKGAADNPMLLSGISEHWNSQQAFDIEKSAKYEQLELLGTDFCVQVSPQIWVLIQEEVKAKMHALMSGSLYGWLASMLGWLL